VKGDASALNRLIIYFFIPIIALLHIPKLEIDISLIWLSISPFVVFIGAYLFSKILKRTFAISDKSFESLVLTSGIGSTSFVGFPIFEFLYGSQGLAYGVLLSLGGTILVFNTIGMFFLVKYGAEKKLSLKGVFKRLFSFFPFLIFLLAILFNLISLEYPTYIQNILEMLAKPFSVIALLAIGLQIQLGSLKKYRIELFSGLLYKLVLAPLLIYLLIWVVFDKTDVVARVCILGAGIGSMNAISVLAAEKSINPELSLLMPGLGIPISTFSLFAIDYLL
jgi:predicted permease